MVDCLLQYGASYLGVTPATMTVADLNELLFEIFPRKVSMEPEDAGITILEVNAFFRFVHRKYSIAGAKKLAGSLNGKAAKRLAGELGNESNFGIAKSSFARGTAAGYDMTTQDGLDQFAMFYNQNPSQPEPGSGNLLAEETVEFAPTIRRETPRIGRNDPCHCGSGKKYKKCCLQKGG
jgi:hypothetical protein